MCPGGPHEAGFQNIGDEDDDDMPVPVHTFLVPVRVPCFLLDSCYVTSATDSLTGIATSSRVDDTRKELLYRVYLESGHSLDINVGFLEIILLGPEDCEEQREPMRGQVRIQELQTHGRYSSCEEDTDQEDDGNHWPMEMLHDFYFYNFP
jgi:hypothetical protein